MTTQTQTHTGRIYVACLSAYSAGILHGEWIEATADADELKLRVQAMLDRSPEPYAEEWAIHDYEGFGYLPEYEDLDHIAERVALWNEHGQNAIEAYMHNYYRWDLQHFEDHYRGSISVLSRDKFDWCFDDFMECCHLSGADRAYFEQWVDLDKIERAYDHSHSFVEYGNEYHIFSS